MKQLQNIQFITKYTITINKGTIIENTQKLEVYKETPKIYYVKYHHPHKIHKLEDIDIIAYSAWNHYDSSLSSWIYLLDPSLIPEYRNKILNGYKNGLIKHKTAIMLNLEAIINYIK